MPKDYLSQQERDDNQARIRSKERQRLVHELGSDGASRILQAQIERHEHVYPGAAELIHVVEEEILDCIEQIEILLERLWSNQSLLGSEALFDQEDAATCREAHLLTLLQNAYESLEEAADILKVNSRHTFEKGRADTTWDDGAEVFEEGDTDADEFDELQGGEKPPTDYDGNRSSFWSRPGRPPKGPPGEHCECVGQA